MYARTQTTPTMAPTRTKNAIFPYQNEEKKHKTCNNNGWVSMAFNVSTAAKHETTVDSYRVVRHTKIVRELFCATSIHCSAFISLRCIFSYGDYKHATQQKSRSLNIRVDK